jgi:N-acetyl-anhydromuramyl-L-alanine amidase AmpD
MREINKIIIHHSGTDYAHHDNVAFIRKVHVKQNGWSDIGYHYFIDSKNGELFICRPVSKVGAHCLLQNNGSIGICVSGMSGINIKQRNTLKKLCKNLVDIFNLTNNDIYKHRDFANTLCPNFSIEFLRGI